MRKRTLPDHYTSLVQQTIASYTQAGMQYNVTQAAAQSFITSKTFNCYFNRVIGTSPNNTCLLCGRVLRLRSMLKAGMVLSQHSTAIMTPAIFIKKC